MSLQEALSKEGLSQEDNERLDFLNEFLDDLGFKASQVFKFSQGSYDLKAGTSIIDREIGVNGNIKIKSNPAPGDGSEKGHPERIVRSSIEGIVIKIDQHGSGFLDFAYEVDAAGANEQSEIPHINALRCSVKIHLRYGFPHGYRAMGDPSGNKAYRDDSGKEILGSGGTLEDRAVKFHLLGKGWSAPGRDKTFDDFKGKALEYDTYVLNPLDFLQNDQFVITIKNAKSHAIYAVANFEASGKISYNIVVIDKKEYGSQEGFDPEHSYSPDIIAGLKKGSNGTTIYTFDVLQRAMRLFGKIEGKHPWLGKIISGFGEKELFGYVQEYGRSKMILEGLLAVERIVKGYDDGRRLIQIYGALRENGAGNNGEGNPVRQGSLVTEGKYTSARDIPGAISPLNISKGSGRGVTAMLDNNPLHNPLLDLIGY